MMADELEALRKAWLDDSREIIRLKVRVEELETTLERIRQWCDAYPADEAAQAIGDIVRLVLTEGTCR